MNEAPKSYSNAIETLFKWRESGGDFHCVDKMETRHLFYTLRMVWNHCMPEEVRLHPYKRYTFSGYYTDSYLQSAIIAIGKELFARNDIHAAWKKDLDKMRGRFSNFTNDNVPQIREKTLMLAAREAEHAKGE